MATPEEQKKIDELAAEVARKQDALKAEAEAIINRGDDWSKD